MDKVYKIKNNILIMEKEDKKEKGMMNSEKTRKKDKLSIEIDKEKTKKIIFIIAIVLITSLVFFGIQKKIQKAYDRGYEKGFSEGMKSIISSQTATEEFYIFNNGSITNVSIAENCKIVDE